MASMNHTNPGFEIDADTIKRWAQEYQAFNSQPFQVRDKRWENEWERECWLIAMLESAISKRDYLTKDELYEIYKWKSPWPAKTTEQDDMIVRRITVEAFSQSNPISAINTLCRLHGVGRPVASAILHLCHNNVYPILDFRIAETVQHYWPSAAKVSMSKRITTWTDQAVLQFVELFRRILDRLGASGVSKRELNRALWWHSKRQDLALTHARSLAQLLPVRASGQVKASYEYDAEADVLYVSFRIPNVAETSDEVQRDVLARYDAQGELIGYTVLNASRHGLAQSE